MIAGLITILVVLLFLAIVFYIVKLAAGYFGAPAVIVNIIGLILILVFLLYALRVLGVALPALH